MTITKSENDEKKPTTILMLGLFWRCHNREKDYGLVATYRKKKHDNDKVPCHSVLATFNRGLQSLDNSIII